jgi:hypothetical protein
MSTPAPKPKNGTKRCPQCWRVKPWPAQFIGRRGSPIGFCKRCQGRYRLAGGWSKASAEVRMAAVPTRRDPKTTGRILFTLRSNNKKTGPIPVSMSERGTCPTSCSLYEAGCYASYGKLGAHWRRRGTAAKNWITWRKFLERVRALPEGQLWRHNEAGDLAGKGAEIDGEKLEELVEANRGRHGFTYTHKTGAANHALIKWANQNGFTINLSADTLAEADSLFDDDGRDMRWDSWWPKAGPVVVLLPPDAPDRGIRTPAGRRVVTCPAQTSDMTCAECELCANRYRHSIVGFRSHGQAKGLIADIVRSRRT